MGTVMALPLLDAMVPSATALEQGRRAQAPQSSTRPTA
jgi:hypothetical protein